MVAVLLCPYNYMEKTSKPGLPSFINVIAQAGYSNAAFFFFFQAFCDVLF